MNPNNHISGLTLSGDAGTVCQSGVITETTDYIGPYELENGLLRRLNLPGGYITLADSVYHHYIPDYQGNILAVVNTRSRQVEQRTNYYPYGLPHGNATGAGVNRRKYSGKELITFGGYDAMDYHARWRPTVLPLFTTPDPLGGKRPDISLYTYCGGDPVNKIDPSGCDEWDISQDGHIVNHVVTDKHDAFYILDDDGNRSDDKSIAFDYGTVTNLEEKSNEYADYLVIDINNRKSAKSIYEFLAQNTSVEWGKADINMIYGIDKSVITTSYTENKEQGISNLIYDRFGWNYRYSSLIHSHPGNTPIPSGLSWRGGDIQFAQIVEQFLSQSVNFFIYLPGKDKYIQYYSVPSLEDYEATKPLSDMLKQVLKMFSR